MQECFARYPTVYNKTDDKEDDDDDLDLNKGTENMFGSMSDENNVETVDQIDESGKNPKPEASTNQVEKKEEAKK